MTPPTIPTRRAVLGLLSAAALAAAPGRPGVAASLEASSGASSGASSEASSGASSAVSVGDCTVPERGHVDLTVARGLIMVPLEVNDQLASFILDTGATRSVVTEAAARRLALARDPWVGTTMSGIGGFNARPNANPRSLRLGGVTLVRRTVNHDTSLTVADFPSSESSGVPIDGLLGRDYLSLFDLDIDVPRRRLTLYQPLGCSGRFLPWTGPYVSVPVTQPVDTAMLVPVELDGVTLRGLLDTGANVSLIAAPGLHRLGLDPAEAEPGTHVPVTGVGPNTTPMAHRTFRTMRIGNVVIDHPTMLIAPIHLIPIADMLLGANWILSRRVWISYATRQVFVAAA